MPTILPKEMEGHFPSVILGLITSDAVYAWAIKEGINPRRVVVIDGVHPLAPVYLAARPLSMFPRFIGYRFIARAPSEIQDTVRLLWQVENELPDDGEGPSMIFHHGLLDGCPCVYASLPAQSPKKEKMVVITPSAVYLWALLEKVEPCQTVVVDGIPERCPPDSVHHALIDNPFFDGLEYVTQGPSMEKGKVRFLYWVPDEPYKETWPSRVYPIGAPAEGCPVGVTGSVDRVDCPSEPEGPVESREIMGQIESNDRGDCSSDEALATELSCEPESPVVLLLEESPPITLIPLSPVDKGDAGYVVALPHDPSWGVSEKVAAVEFRSAPCSTSLPCSGRVKLVSVRKRQRRRARPNKGGVSRVMARRPSIEDNTAAILYLASTLLELADAKKQMAEPVAEPEVQAPEERPVPCAPTLVEHERQYVYQGTFSPSARAMMVPVCGLCDLEAPNALEDPGGACLQCGSQLWMGPFHLADQLPLVGMTKDEVSGNSILIYEEIEEAPGVSAAAAPAPESHVPIPHSEACCNEECAFPSEVASIEGEALETADVVSEVTPSGWTVDAGAAPVQEEPESGGEIMASLTPMPSVVTEPVAPGGDTDSEIVSEPTADFRLEAVAVVPEVETLQPEVNAAVDVFNVPEEKSPEDDREDTSVLGPKESLSTSEMGLRNSGPWVDLTLTTYTVLNTPTCAPVLTHAIDWRKFSFPFIAPPKIGPEEEKDFWVLPGRADPNIFRKEKKHHSCLTNPNEVQRKQDWEYLCSIEREWWYGRTILKNAVKSCGKYTPTKYFTLEVYEGDGQWVDKPHPKYYIPYEDTKARFLHMI
ncbi:hypothetical protein XELAEV_18014794mg [Xenopus laevis]|uniref:Uncharacterized protein n=1 Tax=Xenopus laevis TaxID=8355 RepID=A0A974HVH5_XENLA|nr:hypothetical protein XELAEV_18014794mg [Xenopus laevis]